MTLTRLKQLLLPISVVFAPILSRYVLLQHFSLTARSGDWNGVISDIGTCLFLLLLVQAIFFFSKTLSKLATFILIIIIGAVSYSNHEMVLTLGDSLSIFFIKFLNDPTFVKGSALTISSPVLLFFFTVFPCILFLLVPDKIISKKSLKTYWAIALLFLTLSSSRTFDLDTSVWRSSHFIPHNLVTMGKIAFQTTKNSQNKDGNVEFSDFEKPLLIQKEAFLSDKDRAFIDKSFKTDLSGKNLLKGEKNPLIFLLLL